MHRHGCIHPTECNDWQDDCPVLLITSVAARKMRDLTVLLSTARVVWTKEDVEDIMLAARIWRESTTLCNTTICSVDTYIYSQEISQAPLWARYLERLLLVSLIAPPLLSMRLVHQYSVVLLHDTLFGQAAVVMHHCPSHPSRWDI